MTMQYSEGEMLISPRSAPPPSTRNLLREMMITALTHGNMCSEESTPQSVLAAVREHHSPERVNEILELPLAAFIGELTIGDIFRVSEACKEYKPEPPQP
jgi:hypothetical protein